MKFSACMESLGFGRSTEDFLQGMHIAAQAGYEAIEFLSWWDKDLPAIRQKKDELGLQVAAVLSTRPYCLGDAATHTDFLEELKEGIAVAKSLGCPSVIGQSGLVKMFLPEREFWKNIIRVMKQAAALLEDAGITMVVEPVNTKVDHAGVFLSTSRDSFYLTDMVASPRVKILFDMYHQQITEGDILANIRHNLASIGHFHAAGNPGRHELTESELDYAYIFRKIDEMGYTGYMGMEYKPTKDVLAGLREARALYTNRKAG